MAARQKQSAKAPEQALGTFNLEDYFTREKSSKGERIFLQLPDGTPTADWLTLVGTESENFRTAQAMSARKAVDIAKIELEEDRVRAIDDARVRVLAACVVGWSFDLEFTPANVYQLLRNAAYLADMVDRTIGNRAIFFAKA